MADFEEEARLARETVTRSASNPNAALGFLAAVITILVLGLMWYTSSRKTPRIQNAGENSSPPRVCSLACPSTSLCRNPTTSSS